MLLNNTLITFSMGGALFSRVCPLVHIRHTGIVVDTSFLLHSVSHEWKKSEPFISNNPSSINTLCICIKCLRENDPLVHFALTRRQLAIHTYIQPAGIHLVHSTLPSSVKNSLNTIHFACCHFLIAIVNNPLVN